jgi:hypothetical protein
MAPFPAGSAEDALFLPHLLPKINNRHKEVITIQHYETSDIFLGAYLLSSGGDLSGISFNERQIATFMFTGEGLHQLDYQYRSGTAQVNPVHLRASLNHLRDILFEMKDRRKRDDRRRDNKIHKAKH